MQKVTLIVPAMFADHHVTRVRQLLSPLPGVENILASSAFKEIVVDYDPAKTSEAALVEALTAAGYAPGVEEVVERTPDFRADPAWDKHGVREVTSNPVDNQLSGEFRKY